ncbi:thiol-disulfide oxidoreductase DCC family protein [Jannaschia sp. LMIT008]|uniref:thiol-disulfide oxidoreductase DCC family protein n=1 Tax=Jannaschia maritima TaxID=3032585 RepID=UPI0028117539|nr:DCC1-like thiol-disulfide oxidoreductase family protein [Jannaschia sp. LMIT008]
MSTHPLIVFDGHCVLCHGFARAVLRWERAPVIQFATTASEAGRTAAAAYGLSVEDLDRTYLFVEDGQAWTRSDAWIAILGHARAPIRWLRVLRVVPRPVRDTVYDLVARNRYRWFGSYDVCPLPPPGMAHRFIG